MTAGIDAAPQDLAILTQALRAHLPPGVQVLAFGSRATGHAKPWSDLDLCLRGPVSRSALSALREALVDSDLPWRVDLLFWDDLEESFQKIIARDGVDIAEAKDA